MADFLSVLNKHINKLLISTILIAFIGYRLVLFLVPTKDVTIFLDSNLCGIAALVDQDVKACVVKGDLTNDLFSSEYILKAKNGTVIHINPNAVKGILHPK